MRFPPLLIAGFCLLPLFLAAQSETVRDGNVEARLISSVDTITGGEPFTLGLEFTIDPTWHTYWSNPGETGLPTKLKLTLPDGFTSSDLEFPTPKRFVTDFGYEPLEVGYGYENSVIHPLTITPPADLEAGAAVTIEAAATWLMCDPSTCVPGKGNFTITLQTGAASIPSAEAEPLEKARSLIPAVTDWPMTIALENDDLTFQLDLPADTISEEAKLQFFPNDRAVIDPNAAPEFTLRDDSLSITVPKYRTLKAVPDTFTGLLVAQTDSGKAGYKVSFGDDTDASAPSTEVTETKPSGAAADADALPFGGGLLGILLAAFLGGIILNIMPCVFPVISLKVMSFVGQAGEDRKKVLAHSLTFALGILVFFWILTIAMLILRSVGSGDLGWGVQLREPAFVIGLIFVMVVVAMSLFGVFEFGTSMTSVGGDLANKSGYAGSFWSGALAVLLATPCTAPLMAPAIGFALVQPAPIMFLVFTTLGLGLAAPYFLFAIFPKLLDVIPPPGAWMETFKQFMGFPMLAVAVWLIGVLSKQLEVSGLQWALTAVLLVAIAGWIVGRFGGFEKSKSSRLKAQIAALLVFLAALGTAWNATDKRAQPSATNIKEVIAGHRADGRNVFVDFTAEWCITCKANERLAIKTDATQTLFEENNIEFVIADWTNPDPHIASLLKEHGRAGVPLYLLYPADTSRDAIMIKEGIITPGDIADAVEKL